MRIIWILLLLLVVPFVSGANSENYAINALVISGGGTNISSENFNHNLLVGDIAGNTASSNYETKLGFWYFQDYFILDEIPFTTWLIIFAWIIMMISVATRSYPIIFLAAALLLVTGIQMLINGIGETNNWFTQGVAFIHLGVSLSVLILMVKRAKELKKEEY
jgi:hypothetical protein